MPTPPPARGWMHDAFDAIEAAGKAERITITEDEMRILGEIHDRMGTAALRSKDLAFVKAIHDRLPGELQAKTVR